MVESRMGSATMVMAAAGFLLLLGSGNAQAADACSEARVACLQAANTTSSVCRQDCRTDVQDAIAAAQVVCEDQALDPAACRDLVKAAARGVAQACRPDCKDDRKDDRAVCRQDNRDCRDAFIDPLDPACVQSCRDDFAPCRDDSRACHSTCRDDADAAVQACRDSGLEFRELIVCIHDARRTIAVCSSDCNDANMCHEGITDCLNQCPVEAP